jgi:hypothetical protein
MFLSRASVVIALLAVTLVASASATESTINPGVGIGKVKLGMTRAQAEHALGRHDFVNERSSVNGAPYLELGWDFGTWTVGLLRGRVVQVTTTLHDQKTAEGIGNGSTMRPLLRVYPHVFCGDLSLMTIARNGAQTVYRLNYIPREHPEGTPQSKLVWWVREVVVRKPFRPQPEFAHPCRERWREQNMPRW